MQARAPRRTGTASATEKARQLFHDCGGTLWTSEVLAAGVHPRTLYGMQSTGELERLARGLPPLSDPDLATVAKLVPQGVICLISKRLGPHGRFLPQFCSDTAQRPKRQLMVLGRRISATKVNAPNANSPTEPGSGTRMKPAITTFFDP